eukprot:5427692-Karenia_brevis.AAC.1
MAACCGRSKSDSHYDDDVNQSKPVDVIPKNDIPLSRIHNLLDGMAKDKDAKNEDANDDLENPSDDEQGRAHQQALKQSEQMLNAMTTTSKL